MTAGDNVFNISNFHFHIPLWLSKTCFKDRPDIYDQHGDGASMMRSVCPSQATHHANGTAREEADIRKISVDNRYIDIYSKPGDTIAELNQRREQLRELQATVEGAPQSDDDLLKMIGYTGHLVPSSK